MDLIDSLVKQGWLKTPRIIKAFKEIKRVDFMPDEIKHLAEIDEAMPIGYGQTISQPMTVAFMLEQLQPNSGQNILDIGSGSGWTTGLLSQIVGEKGRVTAIEVIPELKEFGESNLLKYGFVKKGITEFICTDGSKGYKKEAPFDRILVSASAKEISEEWKNQLKTGGRIVVPVDNSIWVMAKKTDKEFEQKEHPGFVFVPLV